MKRVDLRFTSFEGLTKWLIQTRFGAEVMRDVLHTRGGERFYGEFIDRELSCRPTYVLVKAFADGWVEVYGERHVRVNVLGLPCVETAGEEIELERWVDLSLKLPYQAVNYPSNKRASLQVTPYWSVSEFCQSESKRTLELSVIEGINACRK